MRYEVDPVSWTELWRSQVRVLALLSAEPENHAYQLYQVLTYVR